MSEPKLTEAQRADLWRAVFFDDNEALPDLVARMVAAAEQTARAEERERIAQAIEADWWRVKPAHGHAGPYFESCAYIARSTP